MVLPEEQESSFHHTVTQLLFIPERDRRDIQTDVAFFPTCVKKPDEEDLGKLKRLLKYLKLTRHMKPTLTVDYISMARCWFDAYYNTQEDCKGHTGSMVSLGKGAVVSSSRKG